MKDTQIRTSANRYDLYSCNHNDSHRYILGNSGTRPLVCCGLNPSKANLVQSDVTCAKAEKVAYKNGYNAYIMANLYSQRGTDFNTLPQEADSKEYRKNISEIIKLYASPDPVHVWAAWGASIYAREYFLTAAIEILEASRRYENVVWLHYGDLTVTGHPKHPSRLSYQWKLNRLDVDRYLELLRRG